MEVGRGRVARGATAARSGAGLFLLGEDAGVEGTRMEPFDEFEHFGRAREGRERILVEVRVEGVGRLLRSAQEVAGGLQGAFGVVALIDGTVALERADDVAHKEFGGRTREHHAASAAAVRGDPALTGHEVHHLDDMVARPVEAVREFRNRYHVAGLLVREVHQHPHAQIGETCESHKVAVLQKGWKMGSARKARKVYDLCLSIVKERF